MIWNEAGGTHYNKSISKPFTVMDWKPQNMWAEYWARSLQNAGVYVQVQNLVTSTGLKALLLCLITLWDAGAHWDMNMTARLVLSLSLSGGQTSPTRDTALIPIYDFLHLTKNPSTPLQTKRLKHKCVQKEICCPGASKYIDVGSLSVTSVPCSI